jgi:hypothetical protein
MNASRVKPTNGWDAAMTGRAHAPWQAAASSLGLALLCAATPLGAQAADYPKRKPGLWEMRSTGAQANGLAPTRYCIGESTDSADAHLDRSTGQRGACTLGPFRKAGEGWLAESVCRESKTTVRSRALATGDLSSAYRIDTVVNYDPPLAGTRKEDREAVVATWLGECLPGQKTGDMIIPGMGTLNMIDGRFKPEPSPPPRSNRVQKPPRP